MKKHLLAVLAFVVAAFITQAVSHFVVNAGHYAAVAHIRKEPIFPLGILTMLIQGGVLSYLYKRTFTDGRSISNAVRFAWLAGAFLVSYIALAEAAKYSVPAVAPWIAVEAIAGFVQFTFSASCWVSFTVIALSQPQPPVCQRCKFRVRAINELDSKNRIDNRSRNDSCSRRMDALASAPIFRGV